MRVEGLIFALLAIFQFVVGAVYWIVSRDPTGFTCIMLAGGLGLIVGYYLLFTARRIDERPEDRDDAEIADGAGEVGFFSPHSWWPIALAGSSALTALGLVFGPFLMLIGVVALLTSISGLLLEYYVGVNRSQGHTSSQLEAMGEAATGPGKFWGEKH